jgi:hypothetical protein
MTEMKPERINMVLGQALDSGLFFYAFRSGGGLRVLSLGETPKSQKYYGEHPNVMDALAILCDDYKAGGRRYEDVYGKLCPHYYTGSFTPDSELDRWVLQGNTVYASSESGKVVVTLKGYNRWVLPKDIQQAVLHDGVSRETRGRGYIYTSSLSSFPNGDPCVSTSARREDGSDTKGGDAFMWKGTKTGHGNTFFEAVEEALKAEMI